MSLTNAAENSLLLLMFNNTDWANVGDAAGLQNSASAGSFYISLHTSDPGEAGSQTTNETSYTDYARVAVARSGAGFTVSGNSVTLASEATFPACTGGSATITHFGIGSASSGAGNLFLKGAISPTIAVGTGVTPILTVGTSVVCD
jgi:hypothetical protein